MTLLGVGARLIDVTSGKTLAGDELDAEVTRVGAALSLLPPGALFARMSVDLGSVLNYLGAFEAGRAIALIDPALDADVLAGLIERFRPAAVLSAPDAPAPEGYGVTDGHWVREAGEGVEPHPQLAVLLPTSGSTGNPKLVRLSRGAVLSNADAIAQVLGIDRHEVAPTSLPLHYSYGLSVLNSHLVRGATVVIEPSGVLGRGFWDAVNEHKVTSLAGVPYHYEMLRRLKFDPAKYPTLRTLTQAGGKLRDDLVAQFNDKIRAVGGRMFVMYGQTEAAPRMTTVPAERLAEKLGSAGPALPGGSFAIRREDGSETTHPKIVGEVVYRGPNVMMGYADDETGLAAGDECGGVLPTGDLGYLDEEGFLYITGRLKRIGKVFGNRVSLDDLEHAVRSASVGIDVVAAVPAGDKVVLFAEAADKEICKDAAKALSERLHLHTSGFDVRPIDTVPLLASGKIDYRSLEAQV
ncbi:AMP-binding protein [Amycolatopsis regifaucium]|uniref:AMP-dependent acyl-CoA synthetase n=1 Tax=Amycolatopsis regifaucium TaxID=546365 RepID=A0A154MAM8_9PSEU|nr:AMP-binding protein [Amycolatopsis regifaucium]KZB81661.1 AMP-dependent acyl-CoA synthetase [Amycolatopsis regifaucium]OKA06273.1 AMP-dependent acyl-CoA synthetase [Amycolatopsis regifaucium]SFG66941.1 Acyl-CoA synthetase (AMP-forming)/AMP-acid ligase II [Amycolatopsis regifaucium]